MSTENTCDGSFAEIILHGVLFNMIQVYCRELTLHHLIHRTDFAQPASFVDITAVFIREPWSCLLQLFQEEASLDAAQPNRRS